MLELLFVQGVVAVGGAFSGACADAGAVRSCCDSPDARAGVAECLSVGGDDEDAASVPSGYAGACWED